MKQAIAASRWKASTFLQVPGAHPAFMKDNNNMLQGGKLKPGYYQTWANYFTKFIKTYEKEGMQISGG